MDWGKTMTCDCCGTELVWMDGWYPATAPAPRAEALVTAILEIRTAVKVAAPALRHGDLVLLEQTIERALRLARG